MIFKDHGYSPNNFAALVAASGCKSNLRFMTDNDMTKTTFYRYMRGDTSIDWHTWQLLVKKYEVTMAKHKSISQRLKYRLDPSVKQDIVNEWAQQKQGAFFDVYKQLEDAIGRNDMHEIDIALDALKDIGIKSFDAMPNIAKALIDTPPDGNYG